MEEIDRNTVILVQSDQCPVVTEHADDLDPPSMRVDSQLRCIRGHSALGRVLFHGWPQLSKSSGSLGELVQIHCSLRVRSFQAIMLSSGLAVRRGSQNDSSQL